MNVTLTLATRYGLNILGLLGISVALWLGRSIFIPVTIAGLLAAILHPLAARLHTKGRMPWFFSCLSVIMLLIVILLAVFFAIGASIPRIVDRLPQTEESWQRKYEEMARGFQRISPFPTEGVVELKASDSNFYRSIKNAFSTENVTAYLQTAALVALPMIAEITLVLFVILFMLLEGELLAKKVRDLFGTDSNNARRVTEAIAQMGISIRSYLKWRTIVNVLLGLFVALVYQIVGLEQWYLWGILTVILNYVPYIGTIAAGVPPVAEALIGGSPQLAIGLIIAYTLIVTFEGYWIVPRVMGKTMDLNATTVMVACLYWHLVWGVAGLFLAMPLMAALKAILLNVDGWKVWGDLLSSVDTTPAPPPHEARIEAIAEAAASPEATLAIEEPASR